MKLSLDDLYKNSPIWFQQMMVGVYGYWWYERRFSKHFYRLVAELELRNHWSTAQFREYQAVQLRDLLVAAEKSIYYSELFRNHDIQIDQDPWEAFYKIPFLTKETLRQRPRDLLTESRLPKNVLIQKSSGTTGTPTEIYFTPEFHSWELAVPEVRNLNWAGITHRDRRVMFGVRKVCNYDQSKPPFWRYSPRENMAYASIYHLSPQYLPHYIKFLTEYQPAMVMGYPSALNTVAKFALENHTLPAPAKAIFTTSETVTDQIRENIEAAWNCKIYDRYGAVENCMFASQCEYGKYHVSMDVGIIEIVDDDGNACKPGVPGNVICTGLHNRLQPLIRYRIGDVARWSEDQSCACGRSWPILEGIEGRYEDICITPDGRQLLRFDTVFKGVDAIREAQIVQESLTQFTINVVPCQTYSEADTLLLKQNMKKHVGDVAVHVEFVDAIKRTSSGKFRAVISKVNKKS